MQWNDKMTTYDCAKAVKHAVLKSKVEESTCTCSIHFMIENG